MQQQQLQDFIIGGGLAGGIAMVVRILKPFIELKIKPESGLHDSIIRSVALLLGVLLEMANYFLTLSGPITGPALEVALVQGFGIGAFAVTTYHLVV